MLTAIERIDILARAIGTDVGALIKDQSPSASNQIATKLTLLEQAWKDGFAEILSTQTALQLALAEVQAA
jgi:hypothetical protein